MTSWGRPLVWAGVGGAGLLTGLALRIWVLASPVGGLDADEATVALAKPVDGAAPGQVACLMDGDLVVGHGTIV